LVKKRGGKRKKESRSGGKQRTRAKSPGIPEKRGISSLRIGESRRRSRKKNQTW